MRETLKTNRLVLRPLTLEDAPAFAKLANDMDIARMTASFPHPFPLLSAEFKLMHMRTLKHRALAYPYVITKTGGELMGMVDIFKRGPNRTLELGYWLGRPYWGHGFTTEACRAVLKEAYKSLGAIRVEAGVYIDNPASLSVLYKLGFNRDENYTYMFSMARLEKAKGLNLSLDLNAHYNSTASDQSAPPPPSPLRIVKNAAMRS